MTTKKMIALVCCVVLCGSVYAVSKGKLTKGILDWILANPGKVIELGIVALTTINGSGDEEAIKIVVVEKKDALPIYRVRVSCPFGLIVLNGQCGLEKGGGYALQNFGVSPKFVHFDCTWAELPGADVDTIGVARANCVEGDVTISGK